MDDQDLYTGIVGLSTFQYLYTHRRISDNFTTTQLFSCNYDFVLKAFRPKTSEQMKIFIIKL